MADRASLDESPFRVPKMACKECGKPWEGHHPIYCDPHGAALLACMVVIIGVCLVIIAVVPLFMPRW